jgi:signal transduction histidine kinase
VGEELKNAIKIKKVEILVGSECPKISEINRVGKSVEIPLKSSAGLEGVLRLGEKISEDPYDEKDITLFRTIQAQILAILDRIRPYEQVKKDFEASQKKLYEAERMLERSQRLASLGTIAAGVAHEIRNPLGIIQLAVEQLTPQKITNEAMLEKFKEEVKQNIKHITSIVRSMLSLTKGEKKEITEVDLNEVINATLELFTVSRIRLIKELNPLPKIPGNPEELKQVFINLIDNAIHAMPEGGDLRIKSYQSSDAVVVEVSDTGIGIDEKDLPRIFDPFFSTRHEGAGLGLSIVYRIVREHSGEIEVKSQKGKGTTFTLKFPAKV